MLIFKRSSAYAAGGGFLAAAAGVLAGIAAFLLLDIRVALVAAAVVCLSILFLALVVENIRFELEGDTLRYYRGKRLKRELRLTGASVRYRIRSGLTLPPVDDIRLYIKLPDHERELLFDCTPLGKKQFLSLYSHMEAAAAGPPPAL